MRDIRREMRHENRVRREMRRAMKEDMRRGIMTDISCSTCYLVFLVKWMSGMRREMRTRDVMRDAERYAERDEEVLLERNLMGLFLKILDANDSFLIICMKYKLFEMKYSRNAC